MFNSFLYYFFLFFIYSVLGWIIETTFVCLKEKKIVDRGFLIGPYCPIYGIGSIGMILYLEQYKDNIITVFILGVVLCSILEYFTSYIMEKLFKTRWWDYSNDKFNINGRICGTNALLFGVIGVLLIYFIHPLFKLILMNMNFKYLLVITIICLFIFLIDTIISFNVANKFKKTISELNIKKDSTQEFTNLVSETLKENKKIFQTRLYKAFPNVDLSKLINIKKEIEEEIREFKSDLEEDIKDFFNK